MKVTMHKVGDKVAATITSGGVFIARFETRNGHGIVRRLDAQMAEYNFYRASGYRAVDGVLVAECTKAVAA